MSKMNKAIQAIKEGESVAKAADQLLTRDPSRKSIREGREKPSTIVNRLLADAGNALKWLELPRGNDIFNFQNPIREAIEAAKNLEGAEKEDAVAKLHTLVTQYKHLRDKVLGLSDMFKVLDSKYDLLKAHKELKQSLR